VIVVTACGLSHAWSSCVLTVPAVPAIVQGSDGKESWNDFLNL
jgi:hypothetical protein